ncbi:MAG: MurR/RpiR family transcriptional regulator [Angelakisella sp.]
MNLFVGLKMIKDLPPSERQVVNYILTNPQEVTGMGIVELSQKAYTSTGSVMRVCKKLNIESFRDFRLQLASDLGDYLQGSLAFKNQTPIERQDSLDQITDKVCGSNARAILDFKQLNLPETVHRVVEMMGKAKSLDFYGSGVSNLICIDAQMKALRLGIPATAYSYYAQMAIHSRTSDKNNLAFLISYTGQTTEILSIAAMLKKLKVPTVSITGNTGNALLELCDVNLFVNSFESVYRIGGMSSRISTLNVLDILYTAYINANYDSLQEIINKTFVPDTFAPPYREDLPTGGT